YDVYRDGIKINGNLVNTTTYTATGLTALTNYSFYVVAKDAAGNVSPGSNTVLINTPDTQAPGAPGNPSASGISQTSMTLNWTPAIDNVSVIGYNIYQDGTKINTTIITVTNYLVSGLTSNKSYAFYIQALDASGNSSNSTVVNFTTLPPPDTQAPTAPANLVASSVTATSLTLTWNTATDNVSVTGYDVYRNGSKINPGNVTGTSYSVTGLTASTAYSFYVRALDAAANVSANSNTVNVTTPVAPGCTGTGSINYQRWNNISGTNIASLTSNANYPNNPSVSGSFTSFEISTNSGDNYGIKVYGYICPPTTGNYTFWIAADDNAELWLSTGTNPANKTRIAYHNEWTNAREWNKYATQKSAAISL
ncbi:MAG: hypothetical protein EOP49_49135, partial [Sphingobacteriales bacterium]